MSQTRSIPTRLLRPSIALALALVIGMGGTQLPLAAQHNHEASQSHVSHSEKGSQEQLYQCPMHPNIVSDKPGKCPICGMELQPTSQVDAAGIPGRSAVELSDYQQQLINMRVAPVTSGDFANEIRAVGSLTYDSSRVADVNARIMGWIEKLYVDKPAQSVEKGEPLMAIYSPDLYSAQREYLLAWQSTQKAKDSQQADAGELSSFLSRDQKSVDSLLRAARRRLELWGISDAQIQHLQKTGEPTDTLELQSPISGVVIEKHVNPMQMVKPGMPLYQLADLSELWLNVDVYDYELPLIKEGQQVTVTTTAYPNRKFQGEVDFIYPFFEGKTRTTKVRVILQNPDGALRPDMYATAVIDVPLGTQTTVPATAVFDTGRRQYVFVKQGEGTFIPRQIELGPRTSGRYVVTNGLAAGEEVVVDGNFLLDSESQLKAAASGNVETDEDAETEATAKAPEQVGSLASDANTTVEQMLGAYNTAHDSLAADSSAGVADAFSKMQDALPQLRAAAPESGADKYEAAVDALSQALSADTVDSIEAQRVKFGRVSAALIDLFQQFPPNLGQPLNVVHCPMWQESPASWLQTTSDVRNPFYGSSMLTCGAVTSTIGDE